MHIRVTIGTVCVFDSLYSTVCEGSKQNLCLIFQRFKDFREVQESPCF